jgi:hypothetical protein
MAQHLGYQKENLKEILMVIHLVILKDFLKVIQKDFLKVIHLGYQMEFLMEIHLVTHLDLH